MMDYHARVEGDLEAELAACRSRIDLYPERRSVAGCLASPYLRLGSYEAAESLYVQLIEERGNLVAAHHNLALAQIAQRAYGRAGATLDEFSRLFPQSPWPVLLRVVLARAQNDFPRTETQLDALALLAEPGSQEHRRLLQEHAFLALRRGKASEAVEWLDRRRAAWVSAGQHGEALRESSAIANVQSRMLGLQERATAELDRARAELPLEPMDAYDRPYLALAEAYAQAGRPDESRTLLTEYEELIPADARGYPDGRPGHFESVLAQVVMAEGSPEDAIRLLRWAEQRQCLPGRCEVLLAGAYHMAQQSDSAAAWYERFLDSLHEVAFDDMYLATSLERLAQLYEDRGDSDRAIELYRRFIRLWEEADPVLQPRVEAARRKIGS